MTRTLSERPSSYYRGITALVRAATLVAIGFLGGAGCGRQGLPGTVPVEGIVTFGGSACPAAGCVYFLPTAGQDAAVVKPRAGWARFEEDGHYRVTTLVTNDGLLPGTYEVRVECRGGGGGLTGHDEGVSHVPAGITLPRLVVPAGDRGPIRYDIDIGARKDETAVNSGDGGESRAKAP